MRIWCSKLEPFTCCPHCYITWCPYIDGNCRRTMPVVKGREARDPLSETTKFLVFKCGKSNSSPMKHVSWWRHQMETFCTLLAFCVGIHRSPVNSPHRWPVTRSFDGFFYLHLKQQLSKRWRRWCLRHHRAHYDVTVMCNESAKFYVCDSYWHQQAITESHWNFASD